MAGWLLTTAAAEYEQRIREGWNEIRLQVSSGFACDLPSLTDLESKQVESSEGVEMFGIMLSSLT
jgi:hypothetical protein